MALTVAWSESDPAGTEGKSQGDNRIREFKVQHREVVEVDHVHPTSGLGDSTLGYHKVAHLAVQTTAVAVADAGLLYTKDVSSKAELHFKDEDGDEIQITDGGLLKGATEFKTGDWIISSVTTAHTGWTNVSATYADKFMRINATPLTTGGADTHVHAGPSHTHSFSATSAVETMPRVSPNSSDIATGAAGNLSHQHSVSGTSGAGGTGNTASGDNIPAFVQVVIFQKD